MKRSPEFQAGDLGVISWQVVLKVLRHDGEEPVKTRTVPMSSHPSYGQEIKGLQICHGFSNMEVLGNLGKGCFRK